VDEIFSLSNWTHFWNIVIYFWKLFSNSSFEEISFNSFFPKSIIFVFHILYNDNNFFFAVLKYGIFQIVQFLGDSQKYIKGFSHWYGNFCSKSCLDKQILLFIKSICFSTQSFVNNSSVTFSFAIISLGAISHCLRYSLFKWYIQTLPENLSQSVFWRTCFWKLQSVIKSSNNDWFLLDLWILFFAFTSIKSYFQCSFNFRKSHLIKRLSQTKPAW